MLRMCNVQVAAVTRCIYAFLQSNERNMRAGFRGKPWKNMCKVWGKA